MAGSGPTLTAKFNEDKKLQDNLEKANEELKKKLKEKDEQLQRTYEQNLAKQRELYASRQPYGEQQGAMEKVNTQTGYSPEGQAGEIITKMIGAVLMALFHTHYWVAMQDFNNAKQLGNAYVKGADGKYPMLFDVVGGKRGKPLNYDVITDADGNETYVWNQDFENKYVTPDAIRKNGMVPPPSVEDHWKASWDTYQQFMLGTHSLDNEQKRRLGILVQEMQNDPERNQKNDMQRAADQFNAQAAANQRTTPVPMSRKP